MTQIKLHASIPQSLKNHRLDQALAQLFPEYSRAQLQKWIKSGQVSLDGTCIIEQRHKVQAEQQVDITGSLTSSENWSAQPIALDIIHEDEGILVINKPAGLVVHPGAGTKDHTLVNALLHYDPQLATLPRAGIVHRLDKETSGLLVVARNLIAHNALIKALSEHSITRMYEAVVTGSLISGGTIDETIGRHPTQRTKMAVVRNGKTATTHFRILQRFKAHTHVSVKLETGRTHQIRVHFAYVKHPLVGDRTYGRPFRPLTILSTEANEALSQFSRQALHACQLHLEHPLTGKPMRFEAPLPQDMLQLLEALQND